MGEFRLVNFSSEILYGNDVSVDFINSNKEFDDNLLSTLIIGPNGTGKSRLLSTICEVFRSLERINNEISNSNNDSFKADFYMSYYYNEKYYEVEKRDNNHIFKCNNRVIDLVDLKLPRKVLAVSFMVNDKFLYNKNEFDDNKMYEYLGVRHTSNATFVNTVVRRIIDNLIELSVNDEFIINLKSILEFLKLDNKIRIYFEAGKRKRKVFDKKISEKEIESLLEKISMRSDYRSDGLKKYSPDDVFEIVEFLNNRVLKSVNINRANEGSSLYYDIDLDNPTNNITIHKDYDILNKLIKLGYIQYPTLHIGRESSFDFELASSGEKQFLFTMINILSKIEHDSIVLIDEPEISLHPNWQINYINYLKNIFSKYKSCHFIIATHSHFMVSDLEPSSSSIVSLKMQNNFVKARLHDEDTFGWSVDDILYNIFDVYTTRNLYIAREIDSFLAKISKGVENKVLKKELNKLIEIRRHLKENDPLKNVLNMIISRVDGND
ncbi:MAG: AAA family ATPase [Bacillota bacterium]